MSFLIRSLASENRWPGNCVAGKGLVDVDEDSRVRSLIIVSSLNQPQGTLEIPYKLLAS
jgi:hypothetical protein